MSDEDILAPVRARSPEAAADIELFCQPIAKAVGALTAIARLAADDVVKAVITKYSAELEADAERLAGEILRRHGLV